MANPEKRVLTIPPGLPFLSTLAQSLASGELLPGFIYQNDEPEKLANVTIYVPTRRAARVLRSEFTLAAGMQSAILPVIRPLGETDGDEAFFDADMSADLDALEPIEAIPATLELARLILAWRNKLPAAIRAVHDDQPLIAPASAADAVWLAKSLQSLIMEVESAGLDWSDLNKIDAQDHADWWQLTLEFLKIASIFWPARLGEINKSSPTRHRDALLMREAERIATRKHRGPVIVAGSTGSLPATAMLIDAVASMENGAVVLPGLDKSMPEHEWNMLARAGEGKPLDPAIFGHPQFGLATLLNRLNIGRDDVTSLGKLPTNLENRASLVSVALSPSAATDSWIDWRQEQDPDAMAKALEGAALIEAANEREEAIAIAIALRLALEEPGNKSESQAALITPDRKLARRVVNELARFGIEADDSAGLPFHATPQGSLLRLTLEAALFPGDPVVIASVLKHPLASFGLSQESLQPAAAIIEAFALRGGTGGLDISSLASVLDERLQQAKNDKHRANWKPMPDEAALMQAFDLTHRIQQALEPLAGAFISQDSTDRSRTDRHLSDWAERTGKVLEAVATSESGEARLLWEGEAGEKLYKLLRGVAETEADFCVPGHEWANIANALMAGEAVKPRSMRHPRVFIFGTLEARLQQVDTVVLGGLNEGVWPGKTTNSPFLSRSMKMTFGLEPPERRTGQIAHDFQMANGIRKVIYSRSLRQDGAPAVASRFLQRLLAICGDEVSGEMRRRGKVFLRYCELVDHTARRPPATRPEPFPPLDLVPSRYSFSDVGRLRRDPYAIYARKVLRLDPVDAFNADPGFAERGTIYHAIVDVFVKAGHDAAAPDAWLKMKSIADEQFSAAGLPPHIEAVWRIRFDDVARSFLKWQSKRQEEVAKTFTELRGEMALADGLVLSGVADRIDLIEDRADIIDYKTGSSPSLKVARSLLDPQLSLEAAALEAGAFANLGAHQVRDLLYVRLKPGERFSANEIVNTENQKLSKDVLPKTSSELAGEALTNFIMLTQTLRSGKRGFISRLVPESVSYQGEYDHLARVAEWSVADEGGDDE